MNRASDTMMIDGHILSDRDLEVFWAFHEVGTYSGAAKKLGISKGSVKRVIDSPWAKRLYDTKVRQRNESFMHRLQELDDKALVAYEEIIEGKRAADKSTMAQAKLIEVRMRAGKEPILDTRSQVTNVHNEQKNTVINLTAEQMKDLTPEELIHLNRTGELPERLRVIQSIPVPAGIQFPDTLPADFETLQTKLRKLQSNMAANPEPALATEPDASGS